MLGDSRRSHLRYLAFLRRVTPHNAKTRWVRAGTIAVSLCVACLTEHRLVAVPLLLPAMVGAVMDVVCISYDIHGTLPTNKIALFVVENNERTSGIHQLNVISFLYLVGLVSMLVIPSWVATDLHPVVRLLALAAAVICLISVSASIYIDHTWYAHGVSRPHWHEWLRVAAGEQGVLLAAGITVPAIWPAQLWPAEAVLAAMVLVVIPIISKFRISEIDQLISVIDDLVRDQAHEGRELVLREMHGNLSTQLRLLTQQAYQHKEELPTLYALAVSANSRLRETMALANPTQLTSTTPDTLLVGVRTLATAVGAQVGGSVELAEMSNADRDLARVVLNDLVGNGLNAGADHLTVMINQEDDLLQIAVTDDGKPMPEGSWLAPGTSSARLARHLAGLSGSLECLADDAQLTAPSATANRAGGAGQHTKTVVARWRARPDAGPVQYAGTIREQA